MRKLYLVPIIHSSADMGSLGPVLTEASARAIGPERWKEHQRVVAAFWDSIADFFSLPSSPAAQIFQDGMVAGGEDGRRVVQAGVREGSRNYEIIAGLLSRGAVLIKTEDIALVQKEYDFIKKISTAKSGRERETAAMRYRLAQRQLLEERDGFIVRTIAASLAENEPGVLFIGAYHEVLNRLPNDIKVTQIKEVTKVREYHKLLSKPEVKTAAQFQRLAEYLAAPVVFAGAD
jgi:hypothetical protein